MNASFQTTFLQDTRHSSNLDQPKQIAQAFVDFVSAAKHTLHIAIYDFQLSDPLANLVIPALIELADKGVEVQIAFDHTKELPTTAAMGDLKPRGTKNFLEQHFTGTKVQIRAIAGSKLMHNKYMIRDGHTKAATVWTGSANFTDGAWTYQENNIITIASAALANYYETDFDELWSTQNIEGTGVNDRGQVTVGRTEVDVVFSPGDGRIIGRTLASYIEAARERLFVSSMMLTSGAILGALADVVSSKPNLLKGIYDATQMRGALRQMSPAKVALFQEIQSHLVGKTSTPYDPNGIHDFMHNKVLVSDNVLITGSFNFSESAMHNAENIVVIHDKTLADRYVTYIEKLIAVYSHK